MKKQVLKIVRISRECEGSMYHKDIGILQGKKIVLENGTTIYARRYKYSILFTLTIKRIIQKIKRKKKKRKRTSK